MMSGAERTELIKVLKEIIESSRISNDVQEIAEKKLKSTIEEIL